MIDRISGLVSVVIPCYNRERYVLECLDSLFKQSYLNIELIIIDDASTDGTLSTIKSWMQSFKTDSPESTWNERIQLLSMPRNTGFAGAVTTGMHLARGEFIAMQDSDDISHPDRISRQVEFLRQYPNVGVVGSVYAVFQDGNFEQQRIANWIRFGESIKQKYAKGRHCVCHGTILLRGRIFDTLGGPNRRYPGAEDFEFIARIISNRITIDNIPEVLYYYRKHPDQRSYIFHNRNHEKNKS